MALELGAYTASPRDRTLLEVLDALSSLGLTTAEVTTGGFISPTAARRHRR